MIGERGEGRKRTVQILRLVDYYMWMGVHKRKRWFQIQRPEHAKTWISELHGCGAAGTLGKCSNKARQAGADSHPTAHWLDRLGCIQLMEVGDMVWELLPEEQDTNTGTHTEVNASKAEKEVRKSWAQIVLEVMKKRECFKTQYQSSIFIKITFQSTYISSAYQVRCTTQQYGI